MKFDVLSMFIGIPFLVSFCQGQGISGNLSGIGEGFQEFSSSRGVIWDLGDGSVGIVGVSTCVNMERAHTSGCIWCIIACKFGSGQELVPIILMVVDKGL